jgi:uncharacterized SAM-binding protein YcdF (DUF218 family)
MFLFLSKLLPLFIYPLGLTCFLLLITVLAVWKRPRLAASCSTLALVLLLVGSNGLVATQLVKSLEWQYLPPAALPTADAIVVLGGGIKPPIAPRPWVDVAEAGDRVLHGAQLYREGKAPLVILSGGRIAWKGGGPAESSDMAELAEALGVPATAIAQDPTSLNTYQNAVNVNKILTERGINRILLVTSAMHMPRSMGIFKKQGIEAIAAPTDFTVTNQDLQEYQATVQSFLLNLLPDVDKLQQTTRVLKEYVGIVVYRLKGWSS